MNTRATGYKALSLVLAAASLTACTASATPVTETASDSSTGITVSQVTVERATFDETDLDVEWEDESPTYIELGGNSVTLSGKGAALSGSDVMVVSAGTFVFTGSLSDGQIIVDSQTKGTVRLVLNGVEINSGEGAPIEIRNADKTVITLPDGSENVVADTAKAESDSEEDINAAVYSKDDLTINGSGTLTVHGNYKDGITSKDELRIAGGNVVITAADDGLVGRDLVAVKDGSITVEAGGDGIKTTNDTDGAKGSISLEGGRYEIQAGADGIQAETAVLVAGGDYAITTNGGSANGAVRVVEQRPTGKAGGMSSPPTTATETDTPSAKGIKAGSQLLISGGTFKIDSADDALLSKDTLIIAGGDLTITSGDDGIHADASIAIQDGTVHITKSYEGIESKLITISGGDIHLVATDDGINLAGGNDGSAVNGRPGENSFASSGDSSLEISGGYVVVETTGDGIDVNGSLKMTGGTVLVNGPTSSGNGALDYDGTFEVTGGLLVAAGSSGMAQAPSEGSSEHSVMMSFSSVQQAGTLVSLKDSTGKTVIAFAPNRQFQSIVMASPDLKEDETYTLYAGGTVTGSSSDGFLTDGADQGGTKVVSFAISSPVTWLTESGVSTSAPSQRGMGGGGFGGGHP